MTKIGLLLRMKMKEDISKGNQPDDVQYLSKLA